MAALLEVENLAVSFYPAAGEVQAVRGVSFSLRQGEVLAVVGESGCGKSVLCKSIMGLLPDVARIKSGSICVRGEELVGKSECELQKLRGRLFSMVFQDPMTSLNPTMTIGGQIAEAVRVHASGLSCAAVRERVLELMRLVRHRPSGGAHEALPAPLLRRHAPARRLGHRPRGLACDSLRRRAAQRRST